MREQGEDEISNSRTTTAEMNNEMQAPINNQVEATVLRRSSRKLNKPRQVIVLTFLVYIVCTGSC